MTPLTTEEVRNLVALNVMTGELDPEQVERFEAWLRGVREAAWNEALRAFGHAMRENYPEDIFTPITSPEHRAINEHLASGGFKRDQISADMMRRAGAQAIRAADASSDWTCVDNPYRIEAP